MTRYTFSIDGVDYEEYGLKALKKIVKPYAKVNNTEVFIIAQTESRRMTWYLMLPTGELIKDSSQPKNDN